MKVTIFLLLREEKQSTVNDNYTLFSLWAERLIDNYLIKKEESSHCATICMIPHIPCRCITNHIKAPEEKIRI